MIRVVVMALAAGLAVSGCATVARGTSEQVAFDTVPSGAEVRIVIDGPSAAREEGGPVHQPPPTMGCVTPCVLQVKRADKMAVSVTKPGFQAEAFSLTPQISGDGVTTSVAGNVLLAGGAVGLLVDGVSGAGFDKCPNPVRIALRPIPARSQSASGFGYDPGAACKAQTTEKYRGHDMAVQGQSEIR